MFQELINYILGRKDINVALFHFNKAIEKLEEVEKQEVAEMERRKVEIAQATAALQEATSVATIARNRANKLRNFFSEEEDSQANINTLRAIS